MQGKRVLVERLTIGDIVKYYHIPLNVITKPVPLKSWDPLTKVAYAFWVQGRNQWKDLDTRNLVSPPATSDELVLMHKQAQEEVDEEERKRTAMPIEEPNTLGIRFNEEIPLPEFPFHYVSHTNTPISHESSLSPDHTPTDKGKGVEHIGSYQMGPSTSAVPQYARAMMTSPQTQTATVATGGGGGRLKVKEPPVFDGKREKYEKFMDGVDMFMFINQDILSTTPKKIAWFLSYLGEGEAAKWRKHWLQTHKDKTEWYNIDWEDFVREFRRRFYHSETQEALAFNKLANLQQGKRDIEAHITTFRILLSEADLDEGNERANVRRFLGSIEKDLAQEVLKRYGVPATLDLAVSQTLEAANNKRMMEEILGKAGRYSHFQPRGQQMEADPNAMDTRPDGIGRLTEDERAKCFKEGRCYRCRLTGHRSEPLNNSMPPSSLNLPIGRGDTPVALNPSRDPELPVIYKASQHPHLRKNGNVYYYIQDLSKDGLERTLKLENRMKIPQGSHKAAVDAGNNPLSHDSISG